MAGLLVAALPAHAQSSTSAGSSTGSSSSDKEKSGATSPSSSGSMGGTTSEPSSGSSTSSGAMGAGSSAGTASATGDTSATAGQQLTGTIQKFDKDSKELTLANSDKKLKVSDDTKVMKDGQKGSLSDIKEGDQVRASYSGTGDTLQVTTLEVMSAQPGAPGSTTKHKKSSGSSTDTSGSTTKSPTQGQ
jgi:colicin import membrane protein